MLGVLEGHPLQNVRDAGGLPGLVDGAGVDEETNARRRTLPERSPAKQLQNQPALEEVEGFSGEKKGVFWGDTAAVCCALPGCPRWRRGGRWGAC